MWNASPTAPRRHGKLDELILPESITQYLQEHVTHPAPFLRDDATLAHAITDFSSDENVGDACVANYQWTLALERRASQDKPPVVFHHADVLRPCQLISPRVDHAIFFRSMARNLAPFLDSRLVFPTGSGPLINEAVCEPLRSSCCEGHNVCMIADGQILQPCSALTSAAASQVSRRDSEMGPAKHEEDRQAYRARNAESRRLLAKMTEELEDRANAKLRDRGGR